MRVAFRAECNTEIRADSETRRYSRERGRYMDNPRYKYMH
jgi:hypothetical protein